LLQKAWLLFELALGLSICQPAVAQTYGPPQIVAFANKYQHITTDTTTVVKSGSGILRMVSIGTPAATETITLYDNTAASGTVIAVITVVAGAPIALPYDVVFNTGLTVVTATAAGDITVAYQ
jgi:hypothetical protein